MPRADYPQLSFTLVTDTHLGYRKQRLEDTPVRFYLSMIISFISAFSGGPSILSAEDLPALKPHPFGKREHVVQQLNGEREPASLPAEIQWISKPWYEERSDENAQMPYLAYLSEKDRVVMLVVTHHPTYLHSADLQ